MMQWIWREPPQLALSVHCGLPGKPVDAPVRPTEADIHSTCLIPCLYATGVAMGGDMT